MVDFCHIVDAAKGSLKDFDEKRLSEAYDFACRLHEGEFRRSGEPAIQHSLEIASTVVSLKMDEDSIIAALLHDVLDHVKYSDIERTFGKSVASLVQGVESLSVVRAKDDKQELEIVRRMFLSLAKDIRVVLIKLADRLHDMRTLHVLSPEKQKRFSHESLEIFAPVAARLGIYGLKGELEDWAFRYLYPDEYFHIDEALKKHGMKRQEWILHAQEILKNTLLKEGFDAMVDGRFKGHYSIYTKLKRKNKSSLDEIYDLFALRICVPDQYRDQKEYVGHLYTILGIIHNHFVPLAHRFKDYVAVPKMNGYRSLHTTVLGLGGKLYEQPTEIQIRTHSMHEEAESGIAAHWFYEGSPMLHRKDVQAVIKGDKSLNPLASSLAKKIEWISALSQLQDEIRKNSELIRDLRVDIFTDRIFVLTPRGEVKDLPKGSTPVDFAYAVHTDIGHRIQMAKVNGSVVPLDYELQSGDVVEIITKSQPGPNRYWLSFLQTLSAANKIKSWFRTQDRERNVREGREILVAELVKLGKTSLDPNLTCLKHYAGKRRSFQEREYVVECIGNGTLSVNSVLKKLFSERELLSSEKREIQELTKQGVLRPRDDDSTILVAGEKNIPLTLANCCKPQYGIPIIGYITRGKGVSVHSIHCKVIPHHDTQRFIAVSWAYAPKRDVYPVILLLTVKERIGLIRDISTVVSDMGMNILAMPIFGRDARYDFHFIKVVVEVNDYDQLEKLMYKLSNNVSDVIEVKKIGV